MTFCGVSKFIFENALKRRRVRIWCATVAVIVGLLVLEILFPEMRTLTCLSGEQPALVFLSVFCVAMFCEFIDSALGMGYGTTLTPLLLISGFSPLQIVPCILLSELVTGITAGVMHHRDGNVDFCNDAIVKKTALLLSILSFAGATAAVFIAVRIPRLWLNGIIAVIILSVGITILATIRRQFRYRTSHIVLVGGVAAFNKGLSGGGYGPLVTAGQVVSGLSSKKAVAITSLAESFTCAVGLLAYLVLQQGRLDFSLALPLLLGAVLSVPLATLVIKRLPEKLMRTSVGVTTSLLGLFTLCKVLLD
jgi:uncharacterized membrane protein YfcA